MWTEASPGRSVVVFYAGLLMPFTVFGYTGFLRSVPRDHEKAALTDAPRPGRRSSTSSFRCCAPVTGAVAILDAFAMSTIDAPSAPARRCSPGGRLAVSRAWTSSSSVWCRYPLAPERGRLLLDGGWGQGTAPARDVPRPELVVRVSHAIFDFATGAGRQC